MPIYEYECSTCGHRFEKMVRIGAETPPCPECSATEVRKLISASGFILKGGGWYKDHYGLKGSDSGSKGESAKGGESKKTESKPDSKPESKSESKSSEPAKSEPKATQPAAK